MDKFRFGQFVCLRPETIRDFVIEGYVPHDFDPETVGQLDVPKNGLSTYRWIFCYNGKRVGIEEYEIMPALPDQIKAYKTAV